VRSRAYPTRFVLGALLLYGVFSILPSLLGIGYAFTDWNSYSTDLHWVGLDNFVTILSSSTTYIHVIVNTVLFTVTWM